MVSARQKQTKIRSARFAYHLLLEHMVVKLIALLLLAQKSSSLEGHKLLHGDQRMASIFSFWVAEGFENFEGYL